MLFSSSSRKVAHIQPKLFSIDSVLFKSGCLMFSSEVTDRSDIHHIIYAGDKENQLIHIKEVNPKVEQQLVEYNEVVENYAYYTVSAQSKKRRELYRTNIVTNTKLGEVYPTVCNSKVSIHTFMISTKVEIQNLQNQKITEKIFKKGIHDIEIDNLASGEYIVNLITGNQREAFKITKK